MPKDWYPQEFRQIVTIGESVTAGGWSTSPARCWPARLRTMIGDFQETRVELFNAGIGANVLTPASPAYPKSGKPAGLERIHKHVIAHSPDLLIVSYGMNDARGGTSLECFSAELSRFIRIVRAEIQPVIVLLGPYFMVNFSEYGDTWGHATRETFDRFNSAIQEVAKREHCLFVDLLGSFGDADWMIHYDGVHPNDLGHQVVANTLFNVLARHCSGLAQRTKELEKTSVRWRDESVLKDGFDTV